MLEGLDKIDWGKLEHAYGSASDVPDQIQALASDDLDVRERALWALYGNIYHQGTIYEATSYAAQYLIELLTYPPVADKDRILQLLLHLATGISPDSSWIVEATREAVLSGIPIYSFLLHHDSPLVRGAAAHLISAFASEDQKVLVPILDAISLEKNPGALCSLLHSLGNAQNVGPAVLGILGSYIKSNHALVVKFGGALAMVKLLGKEAPQSAIDVLAAITVDPDQIALVCPKIPGIDRIKSEAARSLHFADSAKVRSEILALKKRTGEVK